MVIGRGRIVVMSNRMRSATLWHLIENLQGYAHDIKCTCHVQLLYIGLWCLQKLRKRVMQGERVPVIHTVGFFAEEQRGGPGERFLRQLSALTGGTFQVSCLSYCPALLCPALPYHARPCLPLSCPALPCLSLASLVLPCPASALPCYAHLYCSAPLAWATPGCRCHGTLYLPLTMHLVPFACNLPAMSTTSYHHICFTHSSWLPDKLAGRDDVVPAELCCLVTPLQYVGVFAIVGIQARGMENLERG